MLNREKASSCKVSITSFSPSNLNKTCNRYFKTKLFCNLLHHRKCNKTHWLSKTAIKLLRDQKPVVKGPNRVQSISRGATAADNLNRSKLKTRSTKYHVFRMEAARSLLDIRSGQHRVWQRAPRSFMCRVVITTLNRPRICLRRQTTLTALMIGNCSITKTISSSTPGAKWWENRHCTRLGRTCGKSNWRKKSSKNNNKCNLMLKIMVRRKCQSRYMRTLGNPGTLTKEERESNWLMWAQFQRNFFKYTISVRFKTVTIYSSKSQTSKNNWIMNSLTSLT